MKKYLKSFAIILVFCISTFAAKGQYYQIASQLRGLISPALSGSIYYKGYIEASYLKGLGNRVIDFASVSTSQGFNYRSWFFMGVGVGLDIAMSHTNKNASSDYPQSSWGYYPGGIDYWAHSTTTGYMVPVFTDFRFNIGNRSRATAYIDAKIGASFLVGNNYLAVADGFITNREYFYLKPSVGVRIPLSDNGKTALDIGVTYQLLTSNYWYYTPNSYNVTLSSVGATVGFEW